MAPRTASGGKRVTLGLNTTPELAAVIRRAGNLSGSISDVLWRLIDEKKLARLIAADRKRMTGIGPATTEPGRPEMN